jgi:2'-5' RNA ligase
MRCFIAISLPEEVRRRLEQIQRELKKFNADITWTRPEGIHLTLKFLGEVESNTLPQVKSVVEQAALVEKKFRITTDKAGVFPHPHRPRVLWIGIKEGVEPSGRIASFLEEKLEPLGYPREERAFNPHLTLGRVRSSKNIEPLMEYFFHQLNVEPMIIPAEALSLYQSVLTPSGAEYQVLHRCPLLP